MGAVQVGSALLAGLFGDMQTNYKFIIMCGGTYPKWDTPRQLTRICGEPLVARTIRQLREAGIEDIAISSGDPIFEQFGVPILKHENAYVMDGNKYKGGSWCNCFYPTEEPCCYLFGDVVFSPEAIKTIIETETDDIEFFASAPPYAPEYIKPYAEPFALKVADTNHLKHAISLTKQCADRGLFERPPIMWELWQVIRGAPLNHIDYGSYTPINDYTCDVDYAEDAKQIEKFLG